MPALRVWQGGAWQTWLMAQWQQTPPSLGARLLQPLAWLYGAATAMRRGLYRVGLLRTLTPSRPTIVVGNVLVGGAGKTPATLHLVRWLRSQGHVPGVVSRGHGRQGSSVQSVEPGSSAAAVGDEPLLIHLRTGAPVVVGIDRVAAARRLCEAHPEVTVLVADDGLQHLKLGRDIEVVVFDDRGAGNGLLMPAGPLREPLPTRIPPHRLVLYSNGQPSTRLPGYVGTRQLAGIVSLATWWADPTAPALPCATLHGRRVWAAAGLARPEPFFAMLEAQGLIIDRLPLADHHHFSDLPWPGDAKDVVVTEKDAVKLRPHQVGQARVWVARLDFEPEPAFSSALLSLLHAVTRNPP